MGQELYWVIGDDTDAGKTTLATALLRILNRRQCPALGFKPYSGTMLTLVVDAMCDATSPASGLIVGEDSLSLAGASPLTSADDAECIVPVQYVCHPSYHSAIVARVGSTTIDSRILLRSDHQRAFLDRPDVVALFERNGTALAGMTAFDHLKLSSCPSHSQEQVGQSYRNLASRAGVATVVCEGIGRFLPMWRNMPVIDHLFQVGMSEVRFFPNIRLSLDSEPHEMLQSTKTIGHLLAESGGRSIPLPLAPNSRRDQVAEEVVEELLHDAGIV